MKQQYADFFVYLGNGLHGRDSFFHSEYCGLGADMFGIWAYYLLSPFALIPACVPDYYLPEAVTFMLMLKVSSASFTTGLLLRYIGSLSGCSENTTTDKYFSDFVLSALLPVCFSYSSWMIANMTNPMWLDPVIIMPIVCIGYLEMLRKSRHGYIRYILPMMIMIITNYYIAAMILLFLTLFTIIIWITRIISHRQLFRFLYTSLIGGIADIWFLIPVFISLSGTNKGHSDTVHEVFSRFLPSSVASGVVINPMLLIPKFFSMSYDSIEVMDGAPNVFAGILPLFLTVVFILDKKIDRRYRHAGAIFLTSIICFFCSKHLNLIAHGGTEPYGYLYRYSFIWSFACVIMAYMAFAHSNRDAVCLTESFAVIAACLAGSAIMRIRYLNLQKTLCSAAVLIVIWISLVIISLPKKTKFPGYIIPIIALAATLGELSLNYICIINSTAVNGETVSGYRTNTAYIKNVLDEISDFETKYDNTGIDSEKGAFRIVSVSPHTPNDSLRFGYRSVCTYNSLLPVEHRLLLYLMGYNDNGLYTEYTSDNTRTSDALLGIRYMMTDGSIPARNGQKPIRKDLILNTDTLSAGLITDKTIHPLLERIMSDNTFENGPFAVQQILWEELTGTSADMFTEADIDTDVQNGTFILTSNAYGDMYFYMARDGLSERNLELYLDGEFLCDYGNAACQKVINLGTYVPGDTVCLTVINHDEGQPIPDKIYCVTEDPDIIS